MTNTTAKAQLLDLLIEPLKGCKGLYAHRQNLMQRVMRMPDLEVRNHLDRLRASHFPRHLRPTGHGRAIFKEC
ncbi:hypothetical protein N9U74_02630 [Synechococcus sp. AH-736-M02]|nr:hypothetical protein [Synechococcus sp. AH-736-M02]